MVAAMVMTHSTSFTGGHKIADGIKTLIQKQNSGMSPVEINSIQYRRLLFEIIHLFWVQQSQFIA